MIAWMQKHNKYLVITIWIATIAFIGAGFVGWGTYQYGSKSQAIARVGSIDITQEKFDFAYRNLYNRYNQLFSGNFDEKKAKEMGLAKQVFASLYTEALLLNLAKEYGIVVSDLEVSEYIASVPTFQDNGKFDQKIYFTYLESIRMRAKVFESIIKDEMTVSKLNSMLNKKSLPFEQEVIGSALRIADKIKYAVVTPDSVSVKASDKELRAYWEKHKENYLSSTKYKLQLLWSDTSDINVTESELKEFYTKNSFNYIGSDGKSLSFEDAKPKVTQDLKLKKGKKRALLEYVAYKKGKRDADENVTLAVDDKRLSKDAWKAIKNSDNGKLIKPKAVGSRYVTIKVVDVVNPVILSFEDAKEKVKVDWQKIAIKDAIDNKAKELLINSSKLPFESNFINPRSTEPLKGLEGNKMGIFLQKLFTSNHKQGIIAVLNDRVVYEIVEQKMLEKDENSSGAIVKISDQLKEGYFEESLIKNLTSRYSVKKFVQGI